VTGFPFVVDKLGGGEFVERFEAICLRVVRLACVPARTCVETCMKSVLRQSRTTHLASLQNARHHENAILRFSIAPCLTQ